MGGQPLDNEPIPVKSEGEIKLEDTPRPNYYIDIRLSSPYTHGFSDELHLTWCRVPSQREIDLEAH